MIEAYITNLGKYVAGDFSGERLTLPAEKEDVQALLARIGVDGVLYEEIFITDYETPIAGLRKCLCEDESVDELNYLAALLEDLDAGERGKFEAALAYGEQTDSVKNLINIAQNLDCYDHYPDVTTKEEYGRYLIDDLGALAIPEHLESYIDYEAYGRDALLGDGGTLTDHGFVDLIEDITEYYSGREDIPDEYRIFAYPEPPEKMPIKDQLAMYEKMAGAASVTDRPAPDRSDHADR